MSISMDRFGADRQFATFDPHRQTAALVTIYHLQCRCCGFESEDPVISPGACPKCHAHAWERFIRSGVMVENADRYQR